MFEELVVYGAVLGATTYATWRLMPGALRVALAERWATWPSVLGLPNADAEAPSVNRAVSVGAAPVAAAPDVPASRRHLTSWSSSPKRHKRPITMFIPTHKLKTPCRHVAYSLLLLGQPLSRCGTIRRAGEVAARRFPRMRAGSRPLTTTPPTGRKRRSPATGAVPASGSTTRACRPTSSTPPTTCATTPAACSTGGAYMGHADLILQFDGEKLFGWTRRFRLSAVDQQQWRQSQPQRRRQPDGRR
jgi:hypothetical protein